MNVRLDRNRPHLQRRHHGNAERSSPLLTCPLHFSTWDMNSGQPTRKHAVALAEYPVKIEDGVVHVGTEDVSPTFASP